MRTARHIALSLLLLLPMSACASGGQLTPATEQIPIVRGNLEVMVEGRIVPEHSVELGATVSGKVAEVPVSEGDVVSRGDVLMRLDDTHAQARIAEAEAAVVYAQTELARLRSLPREEAVRAAEAAVASAEAGVAIAEAQLESSRAGVLLSDGQIAQAEAALADLSAGATARERHIASLQVEQARNDVWGAQAYRDGVGGAVDRKQAQDYDLDKAEAALGVAWVAHEIRQEQLAQLADGPRPAALAQLRAAVEIAEAQKAQAEMAVGVAEADLRARRAGLAQARAEADSARAPATPEEIAVAEAAVAQAKASLATAKAAIEDLVVRSPMDGTVGWVNAAVGERVSPGITLFSIGEVGDWMVETDDLTEMEVVRVREGQGVAIVPDAIPNLELRGTVASIRPLYELKRGDVTYTALVRPSNGDQRLRWGMTVLITVKE